MQPTLSRRDLMTAAASLGVGAALAVGAGASAADPLAAGAAPATGRAYLGTHQPQPLPFDPTKLDGLSEKLIRSHWENNYQGAVNALNTVAPKIPALVADKDWPPYLLGGVKREELLRTGSMVMHQLYFANLGGDGKIAGDIVTSLDEWFGAAAAWEAPLLVCDMYEHAYALDYGAAAPKYVDAFMRNVNWGEVNRRFIAANKAAAVIAS